MSETVGIKLETGASVEKIEAFEKMILRLMDSERGDRVLIEALHVVRKAFSIDYATIKDCIIKQGE